MSLLENFDKDIITAMKEKNTFELGVLRMTKAAMKQEVIDHKKEMNEELLIDCVTKQIKMRKDSISEYEKAGRSDLVEKNQQEIDILTKYLPEQLTDEEVEKIIDEAFETVKPTSNREMGLIMKEVTPKLKGKTDMKKVSEIIRSKLSNL